MYCDLCKKECDDVFTGYHVDSFFITVDGDFCLSCCLSNIKEEYGTLDRLLKTTKDVLK